MFEKRFLFLSTIENTVTVDRGMLILDPAYKGKIFCKGIYVQTVPEIEYGYDLKWVRLDRDRSIISGWDLNWEMTKMHQEALASQPEKMAPVLYAALVNKTADVDGLERAATIEPAVTEAMVAAFRATHGDDAVPVESIGDSAKLGHAGLRGVVVPAALKKVLEPEISAKKLIEKLNTDGIGAFSWDALTETEQENLFWAIEQLQPHVDADLLDRINVVEFQNAIIMGNANIKTGKVNLAKKILSNKMQTLSTVVHEFAHIASSAGDGEKSHVAAIEQFWTVMYKARI
jgi:hypothetical protein